MEDGRNTQASAGGDSPNGASDIGRILEQTRREKGLSLEEVEQATKIRKRYLTGLEREDYAMLPDAVYARGFLKTYANYLGLDGEALSQQMRSRRKPRRERGSGFVKPESEFERPLITPGGVSGTEKRRISTSAVVTLLVAILVLAAVIGTLYFVGRGVLITQASEDTPPAAAEEAPDDPSQDEKAPSGDGASGDGDTGDGASGSKLVDRSQEAGGSADGQASGEQTSAGQSPPPEVLLVSITVQERPSWLLIRADGALAYEETAPPGFTQTFEADRQLSITSGDAGAVTVEVNGQDAGVLGVTGDVVTRNFTLKSAS